jgi:hypothetical protein
MAAKTLSGSFTKTGVKSWQYETDQSSRDHTSNARLGTFIVDCRPAEEPVMG